MGETETGERYRVWRLERLQNVRVAYARVIRQLGQRHLTNRQLANVPSGVPCKAREWNKVSLARKCDC